MKKLKDLSISKKLFTNFLCMLAIILVVGIVGIVGMVRIDQNDTYLYEQQTAPISHLMNATKSLYQIRVDARSATINAGKADKIQQYENDYLTQKKTFLSESAAYTATITSASSLATAKEASEIFSSTFDPVIQKAFDLAKAGDQAGSDAAGSAVTDKVQTLFKDYDKLSASRMSSAKSTSDSNDQTALPKTLKMSARRQSMLSRRAQG